MAIKSKNKIMFILLILFFLARIIVLLSSKDVVAYEEVQPATIAYELYSGPRYALFEYLDFFGPHQGGLLVDAFIILPFYHIFGPTSFAFKLGIIFMSSAVFIMFYLFCYKFFGRGVAVISSLFFIFSPPFFTIRNITTDGPYTLSLLFILLVFYNFLDVMCKKKSGFWNFALFGFFGGLGIFINLNVALPFLICLIFLIFYHYKSFKKHIISLLLSFIIGLSPLIYYIFSGGAKAFANFNLFNNSTSKLSLSVFLQRIKSLIFYHLPNSFQFKPFLSQHFLNYLYHYLFVISFISIIFIYRRDIKSLYLVFKGNLRNECRLNKEHLIVFILIFILLFLFIFSLSSLSFSYVQNYRYLLPIYPFVFLVNAFFISNLLKRKNKPIRIISIIILIIIILAGLIGNIFLMQPSLFGKLSYIPYNQSLLAEAAEYNFEYNSSFPMRGDLEDSLKLCHSLSEDFREVCYENLITNFAERLLTYNFMYLEICDSVSQVPKDKCLGWIFKNIINKNHNLYHASLSDCSEMESQNRDLCIEYINEYFGILNY